MRPDPRRAGEGELAQARVREERVGRGRITGGDDRQAALGEAGRRERLGQRERRQGRRIASPEDHRAAGRKRRRDPARRDREREVPRGDDQAGTHGTPGDDELAVALGMGLEATRDPDRLLGVPLEVLGREGHLLACLGEGLARLEAERVSATDSISARRRSAARRSTRARPRAGVAAQPANARWAAASAARQSGGVASGTAPMTCPLPGSSTASVAVGRSVDLATFTVWAELLFIRAPGVISRLRGGGHRSDAPADESRGQCWPPVL